jgi:hypothetical protein
MQSCLQENPASQMPEILGVLKSQLPEASNGIEAPVSPLNH